MLTPDERKELVAVAKLYYEENLTQAEVAKRVGVSRPLISKLLAKAREVGIVHIEIRADDEGNADLLASLQQRYGLQGGLVLPKSDNPWQSIARYLATELCYDRNVGVGWGFAVGEVIKELANAPGKQQEGVLYPLVGTAHIPHRGYHPDEMVQLWGKACGRSVYPLQCQAFPASDEERCECEGTTSYGEVSSLWQQTDAVVIGVKGYPSVPDEATATRFGDALQCQKAVGNFLSYYYNERGEFISGNNDYCVHMPLALLRRSKKVVGVAVNVGVKALRGALATGMFTHLILTEEQARALL